MTDACTVTGEADALVHIRAADIRHFEQVVERIAAEPFVQRTEASSCHRGWSNAPTRFADWTS